MHLVSCRHSTSGRTDLRNFATISMRSRTELIFHVVREKRIGMLYQGDAEMTRTLPSPWSGEGEEMRRLLGFQPGDTGYLVKSILNRPGSTFLVVSRL